MKIITFASNAQIIDIILIIHCIYGCIINAAYCYTDITDKPVIDMYKGYNRISIGEDELIPLIRLCTLFDMACFLIIRFFTLDHCGKVAWGCFIITKIIVLIAQYIQPSSEGWYGVKKVIWIIAYTVLFFCDIVKVDIIYAIVEKTEIFLNKYNTLLKHNLHGI